MQITPKRLSAAPVRPPQGPACKPPDLGPELDLPRRKAACAARAKILKALAHPSRLLIAEELARGERCVCELTALVGADMSTVSRHLGTMQQAGIIEAEKRGAWVHYRLTVPCILNFIGCCEAVIERNAREHAALGPQAADSPRLSSR